MTPATTEEATASLPEGRPCWIELYTPDTTASASFYRELLGWETTEPGDGSPLGTEIRNAGRLIGSIESSQDDPETAGWRVTLLVDDVEATVAATPDAGGTVVLPAMEVEGTGMTWALLRDADGALLGVLTDPEALEPHPLEAGMPVWYEVLARDLERGAEFYRGALGWTTHREEAGGTVFPYYTNGSGPAAVCGIGDIAVFGRQDTEPAWRVYLGVADLDEAVGRVRELGGTVREEPSDSPWGRLAEVADPHGAVLRLCQV